MNAKRTLTTGTAATRRAGNLAAVSVLAFVVLFWVSSEVAAFRVQSPWSEDPWDAVMSVAIVVVPFVAFLTFLRAQRWRGPVSVPVLAHMRVLRGIGVALGLVGIATATAVAALLTGVRSESWGTGTPVLGGLLVLTGGLWVAAMTSLVVAWRALPAVEPNVAEPDALDDVIDLARDLLGGAARDAPRVARRGIQVIDTLDRFLELSRFSPRLHPHAAGLVACTAFGAAFSTWHALIEGIPSDARAVVVWSLYAILSSAIAAGAYVGLRRYLRLVGHD
jgi:hypothetical protein